MNFIAPACEILNLLYVDGICTTQLNHSIRRALEKGLVDEARIMAQQSIDFCTDMTSDAAYTRGMAEIHTAIIAHAAGDLEQAHWDYLHAGIQFKISNHPGSCWHEAVTDLGCGLVAKAQRQWSEANQSFDHGLHLLTQIGAEDVRVGWLTTAFNRRIHEIQTLATQSALAVDTIPVVGTSAAGPPRLAVPVDPEEAQWNALHLDDGQYRIKVDIESRWMDTLAVRKPQRYFAVVADGDSMLKAGIDTGDYVIFRPQPVADNGDIVVVLIDYLEESHSTIKRFYLRNGRIILKADNPKYDPQELAFKHDDPGVKILGKVVAVATRKA